MNVKRSSQLGQAILILDGSEDQIRPEARTMIRQGLLADVSPVLGIMLRRWLVTPPQ